MADHASTSPNSGSTFPRFNDLPKEIRLTIWEKAASDPVPRLVLLRLKPLKKSRSEMEQEQGISTCQFLLTSEHDEYPWSLYGPVPIHYNLNRSFWDTREDLAEHEFIYGCYSSCKPPPILLACQESFKATSKFHPRAFKTSDSNPETYFNFQVDTLFLRFDVFNIASQELFGGEDMSMFTFLWYLRNILDPTDLQSVQKLAVVIDQEGYVNTGPTAFLENWLVDILSIFLGLKTLTLVLEHYDKTDGDHSTISFLQPLDLPGGWERVKQHFANPENLDNPVPLPPFEPLSFERVDLDILAQLIDVRFPNEDGKPAIPIIQYRVGHSLDFVKTHFFHALTLCGIAQNLETASSQAERARWQRSLSLCQSSRNDLRWYIVTPRPLAIRYRIPPPTE